MAGAQAGVVLAGGRSSRMGRPKAHLDWHGGTLLGRAAGLLARTVDGPVLVVRAPGQPLPELPRGVEVVDDPVAGRGPLQGLATGLAALADRADTAFVVATDLPLLHPAFVARVLAELAADPRPGEAQPQVALPVAGGHHQPLAAGYRTTLAGRITALVDAGRLRPAELFAEVAVRELDPAALLADPGLAAADPQLDSLLNVNHPDEYAAALRRPEPLVTLLGGLAARTPGPPGPGVAGPGGAGPGAAERDRTGPSREWPDLAGPEPAGPDLAGPDLAGPDREGLNRAGPGQARPGRSAPRSTADPDGGQRRVRAATLARALTDHPRPLPDRVQLNGRPMPADPQLPLVPGDVLDRA